MREADQPNNCWILRGILFLILGYVASRAALLSFTHDEAISYFIVLGDEGYRGTANHHALNTLLMGWCRDFFGESEFALRLPNVLGFVCFLIGVLSILERSRAGLLVRLFGLTAMALNPFVLDFFSLARGYGLALGFIGISMRFLLMEATGKNVLASVVFGSLAVWSSLSSINFLLAIVVIQIARIVSAEELRGRIKTQVPGYLLSTLTVGVCVWLAMDRLFFLKETNELYFGAKTFGKSLDSLVGCTMYRSNFGSIPHNTVKWFWISVAVLAGVVTVWRKKAWTSLMLVFSLFLTVLGGLAFEHLWLDAKLPLGRTGVYLIFLINVIAFITLAEIERSQARWSKLISGVLTVLMVLHFGMNAGFRYTQSWAYDAYTKDVVNHIAWGRNTTVTPHWLYVPSVQYYIKTGAYMISLSEEEPGDFLYTHNGMPEYLGFAPELKFSDVNAELLRRSEAVSDSD